MSEGPVPAPAAPVLALDHVVVGAATLAQGVAWCRETLGVEPAAGGEHGFMATHNRLLTLATAGFERAYLEIIAVNPLAPAPGRTRWFDLDHPDVRDALDQGPRLLHWVARCSDVGAVAAGLRADGFDVGEVLAAERATPHGVLRWQITVPADGRRRGDGAFPTLIQWGEDRHPADRLPPSGVTLRRMALAAASLGPAAETLHALVGPTLEIDRRAAASAPITLDLDTPLGPVRLDSLSLMPR